MRIQTERKSSMLCSCVGRKTDWERERERERERGQKERERERERERTKKLLKHMGGWVVEIILLFMLMMSLSSSDY